MQGRETGLKIFCRNKFKKKWQSKYIAILIFVSLFCDPLQWISMTQSPLKRKVIVKQKHRHTGCPKITHRMLLEPQCTGSIKNNWHLLYLEINFGRFLLRLSLIKPSQVMFMVKFSPTALNFGCDFALLVHFFGTPCRLITIRPL